MSEKNNKKLKIEFLFWLAAALVIFIFFLIKSNDIFKNLKETAFFDRIKGTPVEEPTQIVHQDTDSVQDTQIDLPIEKTTDEQYDEVYFAEGSPDINESEQEDAATTYEKTTEVTQGPAIVKPAEPTIVPPSIRKMEVTLFFVEVNADGSVTRKQVVREIPHSTTPLTTSIITLLSGPELQEKNKGCLSLIPPGTRLIAASLRDGIATLNFSEEFEFNTYGVEGYLAQLMQIVYTATAFPTVTSVQFLIEGQKKEYLGSEGVRIGTPLSRNSFK
ncbi:MAG: GerMN domain-containing protein [Treponema sp.]|nr:GerMN domain-containing protein [Treponema sp.]